MPRYAIYGSKRLGGAVERNQIKRLFREFLNRTKSRLQSYDLIIIPRVAIKELSYPVASEQIESFFVNHGILI